MIWAWDIDTDEPTFAARYHRAALDAGLLLRPIGATLYVMPPYVLTESDQRVPGRRPGARARPGAGRDRRLARRRQVPSLASMAPTPVRMA
jgi:hypothetical protein